MIWREAGTQQKISPSFSLWNSDTLLFSLSGRYFNILRAKKYEMFCISSIPCFAFFFCIIYSFLFHLEEVTRTHCQVWNMVPSISCKKNINFHNKNWNNCEYSASIGILAPQKYVWKICIALHSAPRLLLCKMYHKHMQKVLSKIARVQRLALFTCMLNMAEVFSLLLLSVVPSTEDYSLHTFCFGLFLFFSAVYLAFSYYLFR